MVSRRAFLLSAAGGIVAGPALTRAIARQSRIAPLAPGAAPRFLAGSPIHELADLGQTVHIGGVPFWAEASGDRFQGMGHPPFPALGEWIGYGNPPPEPTESADVVVIGGGLGGLTAAYLLRDRMPLVLEHNSRFGGNAQAESWDGLAYSLGGAYCIAPDKGGDLDALYRELGLDLIRRDANGTPGSDPVELRGRIVNDFWQGSGSSSRTEAEAFRRYVDLVNFVAENEYPDIPLPKKNFEWILDLDRRTFKEEIETRLGAPTPPLLEAAIQHYFYSSYCAGWEEVSAAAGWNFVAAEPYGLWVFPAGMASMTAALHERIHAAIGPDRLRTESVVVDVREYKGDFLVTVGRVDGSVYSIRARRLVMACPKFVLKHIMPEIIDQDPIRRNAIELMEWRAYAVVNVLLNSGFDEGYFDLYTMDDGAPAPPFAIEDWHRPVDMVNATFAVHGTKDRAALTFYWPVPYPTGRVFLGLDHVVERVGTRFLPHLDRVLTALGKSRADVAQVRITRWGHPIPLSAPNMLANGHAQTARAPIDDRIFFVNQDNWVLPAVENTVLDAIEFAAKVPVGL